MINPNTTTKKVLEIGKECDRSGRCCRNGSGIVLTDEIPKLSKKMGMSESEFKEKYLNEFANFNTRHFRLKQIKVDGRPHGPCVFLAGNDCKIHEFKPLHCRVSSCCSGQGEDLGLWFMEKYFVNKDDPESMKEYELYKKCGGKTLRCK